LFSIVIPSVALVVSNCGGAAVTVTSVLAPPTDSVRSSGVIVSALTVRFFCAVVWKPWAVAVTVYVPGRIGEMV
jgi:hypothetical protein